MDVRGVRVYASVFAFLWDIDGWFCIEFCDDNSEEDVFVVSQ